MLRLSVCEALSGIQHAQQSAPWTGQQVDDHAAALLFCITEQSLSTSWSAECQLGHNEPKSLLQALLTGKPCYHDWAEFNDCRISLT